jgi:hypothetical protein
MGEYVYTLRAKTVKAIMNGEKVDVNLFSYLSKPSSYGNLSNRRDPRLNLGTGKAFKVWDTKPKPKYVVCASLEHIKEKEPESTKKSNQLYAIYTNITSPVWYDNNKFPGEIAGYLRIHSGKAFEFYTQEEVNNLFEKEKGM